MEQRVGAQQYIDRVEKVRQLMKRNQVDAYLIVSDDFHGSEYVSDYFKCRAYVSGFDGSAGTLIITKEEAGLWTDGRYFIQAEEQLEGTGIILHRMGEENVPTIPEYLEKTLLDGQCLGYDGRTIQVSYGKRIKAQLKNKKILYKEDLDLVGEIWENRPELPGSPVWLLSETYAGVSRKEKLSRLRSRMKEVGVDYHLLASLDDIAWLYNLRGNDIAYNPVALSYTLLDAEGEYTVLYMNSGVVDVDVKAALEEDGVVIRPYLQVYDDIEQLFKIDTKKKGISILLDEENINLALLAKLPESVRVVRQPNPTILAKAVKNATEISNVRKAHIEDGVAVTKLIYWLKQVQHTEAFGRGEITELSVSEQLENLRKERSGYIEQSFAPIVATGPHGAIVHYEATEATNLPIGSDTFVLMDTGGQYYQGTTDVTRTIAIGTLSRQQKQHYTAVLRGNLNLAAAHFKYGCTGVNLDYLARSPLWELGLDYNHGTGHGVGYLLNVHEGPNAIRMKNAGGKMGTCFEAGMITSDEPGLYLENQYGIRLENLILCREAEKTRMGQFMAFETLTMVPFDRDAILPECMSQRELQLLNAYHEMVYEKLAPHLTKEEATWLYAYTRPLTVEG